MNVKITDFGFARDSNINRLQSFQGSLGYMAPELFDQKPYCGKQTDVFALGVVLFGLVCGVAPFENPNKEDIFYTLLNSRK